MTVNKKNRRETFDRYSYRDMEIARRIINEENGKVVEHIGNHMIVEW